MTHSSSTALKAKPVLLQEPEVTPALAKTYGMKADEFERMEKILGRLPTYTELGIFSVMWSEHCSYKSSRLHLAKLPTEASWVIQGPGENAGVIDIGDGQAAVFKMESHNHPSYIKLIKARRPVLAALCVTSLPWGPARLPI